MEQQPWWLPIAVTVLIMPTLAGIAWAFKTFVQHAERANTLLSATNDAFIAYLKGESDRAREERTDWRVTLDQHTEASKEMYTAIKEISDYLKKRNGNL